MCFLSQYVSTSHLLYRVNSLKTHSLPPCKSAMGLGSTHVQYHALSNLCINCLTFNHTALSSSLPQPSSAQITCKHSMQSTTAILQPLYTTTQPFSSQPLTRKHTALYRYLQEFSPSHSQLQRTLTTQVLTAQQCNGNSSTHRLSASPKQTGYNGMNDQCFGHECCPLSAPALVYIQCHNMHACRCTM